MDRTLIIHTSISFVVVYARWIVGGVLAAAGIIKSRNITQFAATLDSYRLLPKRFSKLAASIITGAEIASGLALAIGFATPLFTISALALFSLFAVAVATNLFRHIDIDCGCFGPNSQEKIGPRILLRTAVLIALSLVVLKFDDGYLAVESWSSGFTINQPHSVHLFLLISGFAVICAICILSASILLENNRRVGGRATK